jgi:hypothetical protein
VTEVVRIALGRNRGGVRVVLDSAAAGCVPCSTGPLEPETASEVTDRVIVRHRTRIGTDDEGITEYGWATVYDGQGVWSEIQVTEDDDAAGAATETATVTVPALESALETTASVWDHLQRKWTVTSAVTGQAGGSVISVVRRVDTDG